MTPPINDLRELVVGTVTREGARDAFGDRPGKLVANNGSEAAIALAIVYLGDCIRESVSDIGPAIDNIRAMGIPIEVSQR